MVQMVGIRTRAVSQSLDCDQELALDVLLRGLFGHVRGNSYSWQQAAEITVEKNRFHVDEAIMGHSTIADIDEIAGADLDRKAETPTLDDMSQMESEAIMRRAESRAGKGCVGKCSSWWSPAHQKKKS